MEYIAPGNTMTQGECISRCIRYIRTIKIFRLSWKMLEHIENECVCVIADGAAIGPEMDRLYKCALKKKNIHLYFPESFEWLILQSGLVEGKDLQAILDHPEDYIDSREYFSWERFFTSVLIERTKDSYLSYRKTKLNEVYLHENNKKAILKSIEGVKL